MVRFRLYKRQVGFLYGFFCTWRWKWVHPQFKLIEKLWNMLILLIMALLPVFWVINGPLLNFRASMIYFYSRDCTICTHQFEHKFLISMDIPYNSNHIPKDLHCLKHPYHGHASCVFPQLREPVWSVIIKNRNFRKFLLPSEKHPPESQEWNETLENVFLWGAKVFWNFGKKCIQHCIHFEGHHRSYDL